jgi:hypothetical protein
MDLSTYLKMKHLEYCNEVGDIVYESDWIKQELNPKLPGGDKFSVASFNQWINGDRNPDGKNIVRLIQAFGPEVLPYLGATFPPDLQKVVSRWDDISSDARVEILAIVNKPSQELAPSQI